MKLHANVRISNDGMTDNVLYNFKYAVMIVTYATNDIYKSLKRKGETKHKPAQWTVQMSLFAAALLQKIEKSFSFVPT
jgi:hypothetical protein